MKNHRLMQRILENGGIGPRASKGVTSDEIDMIFAFMHGELEVQDLVRAYGAAGSSPAAYRAVRTLRDLLIDGDTLRLIDRREKTDNG